jgi:copper chaperone NosL
MNRKLLPLTKIITVIASIALFASIFVPLWKIELAAPQYPEGLVLKIYPHKLGGDVDVINGLNHYIGMRTLHAEDFFEFIILPWLIGTIAFFGILTLIVNRKWFFLVWTAFFVLFGITAMFDFYRWEYN